MRSVPAIVFRDEAVRPIDLQRPFETERSLDTTTTMTTTVSEKYLAFVHKVRVTRQYRSEFRLDRLSCPNNRSIGHFGSVIEVANIPDPVHRPV